MLLLRTERLPEGPNWLYELKLDGYRGDSAPMHKLHQTRKSAIAAITT